MLARSLLLRWAMAALLVALVAGCGGGDDGSGGSDDRLPPVELIALEDQTAMSLATPADAPRVINLWASWCAPCRSELPDFDEVAAEAGSTISMLGVNVGEDADTAVALVDELGIEFPQSVDPTSEITAELGVVGLPATVFATADGRILDVHSGPMDADQLRDRIDELFGTPTDA